MTAKSAPKHAANSRKRTRQKAEKQTARRSEKEERKELKPMKTRMLKIAPYSLEMGRLDKNVKTAVYARSEARRRALNTEGGGY